MTPFIALIKIAEKYQNICHNFGQYTNIERKKTWTLIGILDPVYRTKPDQIRHIAFST